MTNPMPVVDYDAPPVNPAGLGLYDVATVITDAGPTRAQAGIRIIPFNCADSFGGWDTNPCADPEDNLKEGERDDPNDEFLPFTAWAYDECDVRQTDAESQARAIQTLRLHEPLLVESDFAARLLVDAGTPTVGLDLIDAIGKLEEALGQEGYLGFIHASRRFAARAAFAGLLTRSGSGYKSPMGHTWVFGGGYGSSLGDIIVGTGPVTVWQYALEVNTALDLHVNLKASVAERTVVAGYECFVDAVSVDTTP